MTGYIVSIIALIMLSAFFSATETSFTSLNRIKMKNMASEDVKHAELVLELSDKYDQLLSTILIGNNIANIAAASLATMMCVKLYGSIGATVSTVALTILVLIFGEITPKNIAKEKAEGFALFAAPIINLMRYILSPLVLLFGLWRKLIAKIFGLGQTTLISGEELLTIVEEAQAGGSIDEAQSELITNAIEFEELEAIDVVTPRVDLVAVEVGTPIEEIREIFKESGLSRLPVFEDDLDNIIGIINQKDFHNYVVTGDRSINAIIKPTVYVAESIKASVLLKKMQAKKSHIAIIIDEYGGTTGIVTMEDIIEELVGKIYDEHDAIEMRDVTQLFDGSYTVAGGANVEKFFELFDEDIDINATTINGWVMIALDRLAKVGDTFDWESRHKLFHVRVTRADNRRALMTHIRVEDKPEDDD